MRTMALALLLLLPSCVTRPGEQTPLDRARMLYPGVRAMLTAAEVIAVERHAITTVQGDKILAGLEAVQQALDAGTGDWETLLKLGDAGIDILAGQLRPAEIEAAKAMLRMLIGLATPR
jgi:hypothetical protein